MPTYLFECEACGFQEEVFMTFDEYHSTRPVRKHMADEAPMKIVIQKTSFALKGNGWAKDGYSGGKR